MSKSVLLVGDGPRRPAVAERAHEHGFQVITSTDGVFDRVIATGGSASVEEAAAMVFIGGWVFGGEDGGSGGQAVAQGVERRTLLAGCGSRTGGMLGIGAVNDWCS